MNVIIVGGGTTGSYLASLLVDGGAQVRIVENRRTQYEALQSVLPQGSVLFGNGAAPDVLEAAGVQTADVVAAVTGQDETNLVVVTLARSAYQTPRTLARINNPAHAWLFTPEMGVDVALNQVDVLARLIREEISLGKLFTLLKLNKGEFSLVEEIVHPRSEAAGKEVRLLTLPRESVLTAIIREGRLIIPRGSTVLHPGDEVLAVAHSSTLEELSALMGTTEKAE